jgi:hypothetical protein
MGSEDRGWLGRCAGGRYCVKRIGGGGVEGGWIGWGFRERVAVRAELRWLTVMAIRQSTVRSWAERDAWASSR